MKIFNLNRRGVVGLTLAGALMTTTVLPTAATAQDLSGEIRFAWWGGPARNEKTEAVIAMFEEEYPGISVVRETSDFDGYWRTLNVQAAANNMPCTLQMQTRYLAQYDSPDILRPLDDLVESGAISVEGVAPGLLETGRGADGNLYMIPTGAFFHVFAYNKTMAEEAGLPAPEGDYTWDAFFEWLRAVSEHLPEDVYTTDAVAQFSEPFNAYIQSHGEQVFDEDGLGFDRQLAVDWLSTWDNLADEGVSLPADQMLEEAGDMIETAGIANGRIFLQRRSANQLDSLQSTLDSIAQDQELALLPFPVGPEGRGDDVGTNGLAIAENCSADSIPLAAAWVNFFLHDEEGAMVYASDNGVVTVDRLQALQANHPDALPGQRAQIEMLSIASNSGRSVRWPPGGKAALDDALANAYASVAFGRATPDEAVDELFASVSRALR